MPGRSASFRSLTLAKQLGAWSYLQGGEHSRYILRFAKEYRVGHIVVGGRVRNPSGRELARTGCRRRLDEGSRGFTSSSSTRSKTSSSRAGGQRSRRKPWRRLLQARVQERYLLSDGYRQAHPDLTRPVSKAESCARSRHGGERRRIVDVDYLFDDIMKREEEARPSSTKGSPFACAGRWLEVAGRLHRLTREGVTDVATEAHRNRFSDSLASSRPDTQVNSWPKPAGRHKTACFSRGSGRSARPRNAGRHRNWRGPKNPGNRNAMNRKL